MARTACRLSSKHGLMPRIATWLSLGHGWLLVQAVIAGLGVAVVQRALVEPELAAGRIAIAIDHPVLLDRGYHLCIPTGRAPNPALDDLRGWLLAQACGQGGS